MRTILTAAVLATAALSTALPGTASAGCLTDYLITAEPTPTPGRYVVVESDGTVNVYTGRVVDNINGFVTRTRTFVACAV